MICDARFAAVREALAENVATRGELGGAICVIVDGRVVVDICDGWADVARTRPWSPETVVNVFSVGKAFAALCVLRLVDRGLLSLDDRVSAVWPEFASEATVADVLSHRAGLAGLRASLADGALFEWDVVCGALAAQEPWWPPGSAHGYHVHTFGFLCGELVRRVTGASIGTMLAGEVSDAVSFGLPVSRRGDVAPFVFGDEMTKSSPSAGTVAVVVPADVLALRAAAYFQPPGATGLGTVDTPAWMSAELPSANCYATARGVAEIYAGLLDGRLLGPSLLEAAVAEASCGEDLVLARPSRFGLGFQLTQPERPIGVGARGFGHFGAGGAVGFADPDAGVAGAYVMNVGGPRWQSPRNRAVLEAIVGCL